jgi:hypothetical protein
MSLNKIPEMFMKNYNPKVILTPLICKRDDERGEFEYYDGSTTFYDDATIKEKARKFHKTQSKYIHIKCNCGGKEHKTLKECYDSYVNTRNYLVEITKNEKANKRKIDLNVSGNYVDTFKRLFFEFLVDSKKPEIRDNIRNYEMIKLKEYRWFKNCTGAHQYITNENFVGKIKSLDYNSYYSYLLTKIQYPMYEGEEKILESLPEKNEDIEYGMYRCLIENAHENSYKEQDEDDDEDEEDELDYKIDYKLFKKNDDNKYTHIDLILARKLNYSITLIMDNKPNALIYTKEKLVHGNDLFGEVLNHLQNIKAKCNDNPQAKKVIKQMQTCSWGCLCEVNSFYEDVYNNDEDDEDDEEEEDDDEEEEEERILLKFIHYEKKKRFYFLNQKEPLGCFKSRFARLKVFMLSFGRFNLVKTIMRKDVYPYVIRTHTDSIWVKEECPYKFDIGLNIGQFKIELEATISKIVKLNNIEFMCEECGQTCKNKNGVENHRCL